MNRTIYISVAFWFITLCTQAADPAQKIEQANQAYIQGEYLHAIELYEEVLSMELESAALYYNLGNSYFKVHRLAPAILNYERALRIKPFDENIRHNLEVARSQTIDQIEPVPLIFYEKWWKAFIFLLSIDKWSVLGLITLFVGLMALLFYLFSGRVGVKKWSLGMSVMLLVGSFLSFLAAHSQYSHNFKRDDAIVFTTRVTAKSSPQETSSDLFVLHEGTKVTINDGLGEWVEVTIENGNVGWLKKESIIPVNAYGADFP